MNKQDAIKKLESRAFDIEDTDLVVGLRFAQNTIKQIDEAKKPVIPQFVAEWLEVCKENLAISLFVAMKPNVLEVNNQSKKTIHWFKSAKNQEIFAKAWLYGYEVEKEKLYTARLRLVTEKDYGYLNKHKNTNKLLIAGLNEVDGLYQVHFTQAELEELDIWNNQAFEIEEVTE